MVWEIVFNSQIMIYGCKTTGELFKIVSCGNETEQNRQCLTKLFLQDLLWAVNLYEQSYASYIFSKLRWGRKTALEKDYTRQEMTYTSGIAPRRLGIKSICTQVRNIRLFLLSTICVLTFYFSFIECIFVSNFMWNNKIAVLCFHKAKNVNFETIKCKINY